MIAHATGELRPDDVSLFERLGISAALLSHARIRRVTDQEARDLLSSRHRGDLSGIVFPYHDPTTGDRVAARVRRDNPEIESGTSKDKYLSSYGDHPHVYFTPNVGDLLADVTVTVVLVEAEKSSLALMSTAARLGRKVLPIALGGCWGWRTSRAGKVPGPTGGTAHEAGIQPDLLRVTWTNRDVVILFDSNAATNPKVRFGRRRLAAELQSRGAKVRIGTVPPEPGVNGPDDYRAVHDDAALFALVDGAVPVQPETVEELLRDCGFTSLIGPVDVTVLERCLRELSDQLRSADALRRRLARTAVVARLKTLKVDGAAGIVDAAIGGIEEAHQSAPVLVRDDDPWPDEVDGAKVLDAVAGVLRRYLVLPLHADVAVALWIAHAYAMAAWCISPILTLISPVKRCGKTTALLIVGALAPRSLNVSNLTAAVLFRVIHVYAPTLLSDEADTWLTDEKSDLRGVFNGSHTKGAAIVARCDGDDNEVKLFSTWAAKAIAMIGRPPSTIEDRSVMIELRRKSRTELVSRLRLDRIDAETTPIRRQLRRWIEDHLQDLRDADPAVPSALDDRAQDNWRPLLTIADAAGGPWPARARAAAVAVSGEDVAEDIGAELLGDIRTAFKEAGDPAAMSSSDLLKSLEDMTDRPWTEWSKGKPISGAKLARMLKPFKVTAAGTIRIGTKTAKGYRRESFLDAWTRYLPGNPPFNPSQRNNANNDGHESQLPRGNSPAEGDGFKNEVQADEHCACYGVTDSTGESGAAGGTEADDGLF